MFVIKDITFRYLKVNITYLHFEIKTYKIDVIKKFKINFITK